MYSPDTYHPVAWLVWLLAAALPALTTRNPLYLGLALLAVAVDFSALGRRSPAGQSWAVLVRFGALLWLFTIPFTALTNHYGEIVLFTLPETWPVIGGPITAEAVLYGISSGLSLITLLTVFAVFNLAVDQARLLRMAPGFVYQAGVAAAIAVAFVPQMVTSWHSIREAQQVRGHRFRGLRDLAPLIIPLLVTALEKAVQLAESMEARGFGGTLAAEVPGRRRAKQLGILAGLAAMGIGLAGLGFWPEYRVWMGITLAGGVMLLLMAFWLQGRRVGRSEYRRWVWGRIDRIVLASAALAASIWLAAWLLAGDWLFYYPYPPYSPWPSFQPVLGLAIVLLAMPGLLLPLPVGDLRQEKEIPR